MKFILLLCFLAIGSVSAEEVDVSQAAALVSTQNIKAEGVIRQALEALVSKNTGLSVDYLNDNSLVTDDFSEVILRHYFVQSKDQLSGQPYWLYIVADEDKLSAKLAEHELPFWPKRRSLLYVWLVSENEVGILQHEPVDSIFHYWLSEWLKNKGIPTIFHQVSEDDLLDFAAEDVKNLNPDLIDYVHQVQQQDSLLLVYLKDTGRGFSYRMGLAVEGQDIIIKHRQFVDLSKGFEYLSDFVQSHEAASQQVFANEVTDSTVTIRVNHIDNADRLLTVLNYFDAHSLVTSWQVLTLNNNQIDLQLKLAVVPDAFSKIVDREHVLKYLPLGDVDRLIFSFQAP